MTVWSAGNPPTYLVPSVQTSGTLSHSTDSLMLWLEGRNNVAIAFKDHTAMTGVVRVITTNASGGTGYRYFWDGNVWTSASSLPVGGGTTGEKANEFTVFTLPGDTAVQIYPSSYVSGSVDIAITADMRQDVISPQAAFGLNGGNPAGYPSEGPGSYSIGGYDPSNASTHRTVSVDSGGRLMTRPCSINPWTVSVAQGGNTRATATKAAGGAGVRHICTGIQAVVASTSTPVAPAVSTLNFWDGVETGGTKMLSFYVACPMTASASAPLIQLTDLNIRGSANTAMTLAFDLSSGTNTFQAINFQGYSVTE